MDIFLNFYYLPKNHVYLDQVRSPARSAVVRALALLCNAADPQWMPLVSTRADWTEERLVAASVPMWVLVGQIFRRFSLVFDTWPWRLARMFLPETSALDQQALAEELVACEPCCLGPFLSELKKAQGWHVAADVLAPESLTLLRLVFERAPCTNMHSENRFARHNRHEHASHGNPGKPATAASAHVLSECKTILDVTLWFET